MIWTLFKLLAEPDKWAFTFKDGELYVVPRDELPASAKLLQLRERKRNNNQ